MRTKTFFVACILLCLAALPVLAQEPASALTGMWTGDWGPTPTHRNPVNVDLKWDGKMLMGTVNPGPNAVKLEKTSYDAKTGMIHMEADATGYNGQKVHYMIDGKVSNGEMSGSWNHDNRKGDFKIMMKK